MDWPTAIQKAWAMENAPAMPWATPKVSAWASSSRPTTSFSCAASAWDAARKTF
jgi:hypothetical protein